MSQDNLLDRLLNKGTNTTINFPKTRAVPSKESLYGPKDIKVPIQEAKTNLGPKTDTPTVPAPDNKVAALDQSIYRFRPGTTTGTPKKPLQTPLALAAVRTPAFVPVAPRTTGGCNIVTTYLLTEAGENLMTENNDNIII